MGRIARLLQFVRTARRGAVVSDVKCDPGGGPNLTAEHYADPGDDSHPLTTDYVALGGDAGTGRVLAVGYLDPLNAPAAQPGDKRIYARDAGSGATNVQLWLKNDASALIANDAGSVELAPDGTTTVNSGTATFTVSSSGAITGNNGAGTFSLTPGGDFEINGVIITAAGDFSAPGSVIIGGKEMRDHTHPAGTPPGDTGVNN